MNMNELQKDGLQLELGKLSIAQLRGIKEILVNGVGAFASKFKHVADADGARALKKLTAENEELKKTNARRDIVEAEGLEWDPDFFMSFSDEHFAITINKLSQAKTAIASYRPMKIPATFSKAERGALETVKQGLAELKNGN